MKTKQKGAREESSTSKNTTREREKNKQQVAEEGDVTEHYNEIDKLESEGINVADIKKLKTAGYCTIMSVIMVMKKELEGIKGTVLSYSGFNQAKVQRIQDAARKIEGFGFMKGTDVSELRKKILKISTGSKKFDQLLGGGIESMSITQAFGEFRTGKTQLAHTLCVTAQLPVQQGGGNGKVLYIDTESTFRPQKIAKIAERFGLDADQTLDNISYAKAYTSEQMSSLLVLAASCMMEDHYSLLIIDSLMACFRTDYTGRGELSERQQQLGKLLNKLMKLAEQFNIVIYITNHVMADPGNSMAHVDTKKPIGGHVLAHASTTRLYFRKGKGEERQVKIFDAPNLAENQEVIMLTDAGVADAKD